MTTSDRPYLVDGLENAITGIHSIGKQAATTFGFPIIDDWQLINAYRGNWIARKAVDIPAFDAIREWREWQGDDEQVEAIYEEERRLGLQRKVRAAIIAGRLFGGGAIFIGDGTEKPDQPLDPERITKGGIKYLHVLTKLDLSAGERDDDILSETYNRPGYYTLSSATRQVRIHPSRLVMFFGAEKPERFATFDDGWGDSVLLAAMEAVKAAGMTALNAAELTHEAKIDVLRIKDLGTHVATAEAESRFLKRWLLAAQGKSLTNALMIDAQDEHTQKQISFAGLTDLMRMQLQIVSGAVDIPVTRFLGQSPAGMNATGESDLQNYYDSVRSFQTTTVSPAMRVLDECLVRSTLGSRPDDVAQEWNSLWQESPKERAETAKANAEAISTLGMTGYAPSEVIARATQDFVVASGLLASLDNHMADYEAANGEWEFEEPEPEIDPAAKEGEAADPDGA